MVVLCDHTDDAQTKAVFDRVREEQGRLHVLVCNAYQQAGHSGGPASSSQSSCASSEEVTQAQTDPPIANRLCGL